MNGADDSKTNEGQPPPRPRWALRLLLVLPIVLVLSLGALALQRFLAVAALQNSVSRSYGISFGGPPAMLPAWIDSPLRRLLGSIYGTHGPANQNLDLVYDERLRALFRGSIRQIVIYRPDLVTGDLGRALKRFPGLERLEIVESTFAITEAQWTLICEAARSLPRLKELYISGEMIDDSSLAPLASHPALEDVRVESEKITQGSLQTWKSLPKLRTLAVFRSGLAGEDDRSLIGKSLPGVMILPP